MNKNNYNEHLGLEKLSDFFVGVANFHADLAEVSEGSERERQIMLVAKNEAMAELVWQVARGDILFDEY